MRISVFYVLNSSFYRRPLMAMRDQFDNLSPLDYRYWDEEVAQHLSENAFTRYKCRVEYALAKTFWRRDSCSTQVLDEIQHACTTVTTNEVYEEEKRIHHDIRALVNCICRKVSDEAKRFVHLAATSYDIIDTANAARYKDVVTHVLVPSLLKLESVLINHALNYEETPQAGRTHGQHAVPITFGFAVAGYISRLGGSIEALKDLSQKLVGKFSGAVGAYNALSLLVDDPEVFEAQVLAELGLKPAEHSTQIVPPEPLARLLCEVTFAGGIMANLADDMRHLQRTEIGEVGEKFEEGQVGSSTMPQKQNPINFENAKSLWKAEMPRMVTVFMDQISEHQRDLTNSASARTYPEMFAYVVSMAKRLAKTMEKLQVNLANVEKNFLMQKDFVIAEPLYILLAAHGHPDAHEKVRALTLTARQKGISLQKAVNGNPEMQPYLSKMTPYQLQVLQDLRHYNGIAAQKAASIAVEWKEKLGL